MSAAPLLQTAPPLQLRLESGPDRGKVFEMAGPVITIGREVGNDIVIANDQMMSRKHLELRFENGHWTARNLSSRGSLLIDGVEAKESRLVSTSRVAIGETEISVRFTQSILKPVEPPSPAKRIGGGLAPTPVSKSIGKTKPKGSPKSSLNPRTPPKSSTSRGVILIVVVILGAGYFLFDSGKLTKKREGLVKSQDQVILNLEKSEEVIREIEQKQEQSGKRSIQYQMAQEQYLKGFRDYRQGQYGLAMTSFSAALSVFPGHELARKYYELSKRKFDQKVTFYMLLGRQNLGKNNYRMCKSSYESVMIMLKNENDPIYREAKQFRDECDKKSESKF